MTWSNVMTLIEQILAIIGALTLIFGFLKLLIEVIPQLDRARADFWRKVAETWKTQRNIRSAIASDIEAHVNETVADLQRELPAGWIKKASIKWVNKVRPTEMRDGEVILHVDVQENPDENFLVGMYALFSQALFPRTREVIPAGPRKAAVLAISRRTVSEKKPYLREVFEDNFLESAIGEDPEVADYLGRFEGIDEKGFFTSAFLREIHEIATRARFHELRSRMREEVEAVLKHIEGFMRRINVRKIQEEGAPPAGWYRVGPATSYAFLLVARPEHGGVGPYVQRARERQGDKIERLYILGANNERSFVERVIAAISRIPGYKLEEVFETHHDYRGEGTSIGALFLTSAENKPPDIEKTDGSSQQSGSPDES